MKGSELAYKKGLLVTSPAPQGRLPAPLQGRGILSGLGIGEPREAQSSPHLLLELSVLELLLRGDSNLACHRCAQCSLFRDSFRPFKEVPETHRCRDRTDIGEGAGGGERLGSETDMNTLLYLKQLTNKDLLCGTRGSAQCYVAAWVGGEFWREWIHVYVRLGPFAVLLKLSQHCELAIPQYKIKLKKKKQQQQSPFQTICELKCLAFCRNSKS
ncbi:unnamed protein product [Rangifer tarandus platyrhynchus]|uniref:Uncharacterized protein n=1 Tax=Rangifer tarandus platyrhynchus TaxID=3082113 RepID=A0AC59YKH4_RANTA